MAAYMIIDSICKELVLICTWYYFTPSPRHPSGVVVVTSQITITLLTAEVVSSILDKIRSSFLASATESVRT